MTPARTPTADPVFTADRILPGARTLLADRSSLLLPASTGMDAVTLRVGDLPAMVGYYRDALGLDELPTAAAAADLAGGKGAVVLGRGTTPLVVLVPTPGLPASRPGQAGLFHTALVFGERAGLAAALASAAAHPRSRYAGAADHLVSQAFYFTDPEDNGIELYWDRDRTNWIWHDGRIEVASLPLDPQAFLREHLDPLVAAGAGTADVGHVHLKVGDIPTARAFYVDALGFEVTADVGTALFVSAGGYHHHMGMNTWQSAGAGSRAATLGLGRVAIAVPARVDLDALADRLARHGVPVRDDGRTLRFEDPWKTLLEVTAA